MGAPRGTPEERFWRFVVKTPDCWIWAGGKTKAGYGVFRIRRGVMIMAHRWSHLIHKGEIPDTFEIDHICRNRHCVNPMHLEAVPHKENLRRGIGIPTMINAAKTKCPQGHPYTYFWRGARDCRICRNKRRQLSRSKVSPA